MKLLKLFLLAQAFTSFIVMPDTLLVGNKNQDTLSVIDLSTQKITRVIKTGIGPHEIAISPNQQYAAVVNYGNRQSRGKSVSLIDIDKGKIIKTISHDSLRSPHGIQWFKDNQHVLVTAENNDALVKLNLFNGNIVSVAKTEASISHMLVMSPDESFAAAANMGSGNISLIDLKHFLLIQNIATGAGAEGIDISADGRFLWVTNRSDDTVSVVDVRARKVLKNLTSIGFPIRVKITPDQKYALVTNAVANTLSVFDAKKYELIKELSLVQPEDKNQSQSPIGVLINTKGDRAYIAHAGGNKISVIDLKSLTRIDVINGVPSPDGMGYVDRDVVYQ